MTTIILDCDNQLKAQLGKKISSRIASIKESWDTKETEFRALLGIRRREQLAKLLFGEVDRNSRDAVA